MCAEPLGTGGVLWMYRRRWGKHVTEGFLCPLWKFVDDTNWKRKHCLGISCSYVAGFAKWKHEACSVLLDFSGQIQLQLCSTALLCSWLQRAHVYCSGKASASWQHSGTAVPCAEYFPWPGCTHRAGREWCSEWSRYIVCRAEGDGKVALRDCSWMPSGWEMKSFSPCQALGFHVLNDFAHFLFILVLRRKQAVRIAWQTLECFFSFLPCAMCHS